jgi:hypothetical protein
MSLSIKIRHVASKNHVNSQAPRMAECMQNDSEPQKSCLGSMTVAVTVVVENRTERIRPF